LKPTLSHSAQSARAQRPAALAMARSATNQASSGQYHRRRASGMPRIMECSSGPGRSPSAPGPPACCPRWVPSGTVWTTRGPGPCAAMAEPNAQRAHARRREGPGPPIDVRRAAQGSERPGG
jgi:hypothetical protein